MSHGTFSLDVLTGRYNKRGSSWQKKEDKKRNKNTKKKDRIIVIERSIPLRGKSPKCRVRCLRIFTVQLRKIKKNKNKTNEKKKRKNT